MKRVLSNSSNPEPRKMLSVREILEDQKNKRRISSGDARLPPKVPQPNEDADSEEVPKVG